MALDDACNVSFFPFVSREHEKAARIVSNGLPALAGEFRVSLSPGGRDLHREPLCAPSRGERGELPARERGS
jgi:hypothetical protein